MKCVPFAISFVVFTSLIAHAEAGGSVNRQAEALTNAYKDANITFVDEGNGIYAVINTAKILFSPPGQCPQVSSGFSGEPPLCSVFTFEYPAGPEGRYPGKGFDPGRIRNQAFLKELYGRTAKEVEENCVVVTFLGKKLLFNKKHGAAEAFSRVSERLEKVIAENPGAKEYIFPIDDTFYWRKIQGTSRISAHSFAIAIDLNVKKGLYWQWNPPSRDVETLRKTYPQAIVDAFEAEGFIWGGKWHAFDFMHFEYRPEMFMNSN